MSKHTGGLHTFGLHRRHRFGDGSGDYWDLADGNFPLVMLNLSHFKDECFARA